MKEGIKLLFLSEAEAAKLNQVKRVPVYRVRFDTRSFLCWARRNGALRGVKEIRFEGDDIGGNGEAVLVRATSDA